MPKTKPIIAVDADDTLFDENEAVRLFVNEKFGLSLTPEDYMVKGNHANYWDVIWGLSAEDTEARYEEFVISGRKQTMAPLEGALDVLNELKQRFDLVIVTARDHRMVDATHNALVEHYPNLFKDVHFVPLWGGERQATKAEICNEIGASYLIDDSVDNCVLAHEAGVKALLYGQYGWNYWQELPDGIVRAQSWDAVEEYFNGVS